MLRRSRADVEVVLVMDEPTQEHAVVALIRQFPAIRWIVVVNDHDHPWRTPSRAINVGLRHAIGHYVLVVSPESAFVTDVPAVADRLLSHGPGHAAVGRVAFATYADVAEHHGIEACYRATAAASFAFGAHPSFKNGAPYGSICVERERLIAIGGYDERLEVWGGDDDNTRARLLRAGVELRIDDDVRLLHLSHGPRPPQRVRRALADLLEIFEPASVVANGADWGRSFGRVVTSWRDHQSSDVS
jgi:hypothetical protein